MVPIQKGARIDFCLNTSRAGGWEMCTSITGVPMATTASARATEVWV